MRTFFNESLSPKEKNNLTYKLEILALKGAVADKLHDYLYGDECEVEIDNNPLNNPQYPDKLDGVG